MKPNQLVRICAALLGLGGILWAVKAGAIMATGSQPALTFEVGQTLFPFGALGLYATLQSPSLLQRTGLTFAWLGLMGSVLMLVYPLVPGAAVSTAEAFEFPYSAFVLLGSLGGFLGLALMAIAFWRGHRSLGRRRAIPLIAALAPIPLLATGAIHFEMPVFLIGSSWVALALTMWSLAKAGAPGASSGVAG